ncbi:hypothetical protein MTO96_028484 [Rhipicephalus appendiculatus]
MAGVVRSVQSVTRVLSACRLLSRIAAPPRAASYYLRKDQHATTTYVPERRASVLATAAENSSSSSSSTQWQGHQLDRALQRIDNEVRRTGRVTRKDLDDVLAQAAAIGRLSGPQGLLLVRMCGAFLREEPPSERRELARSVWERLQSLGCPLDASHYNALLQVYLENEFPFCPSTFLATMEAASVQPNRVTFQRLIHRYCQQGDIAGASKILEHMKSQDMAINERVFNSLVLGHCRAGDTENAWNVLEVMRNAQLEPTADTFHTLLVGCAERGHHGMIDMVLERTRRLAGYTQDCINVCLQLLAQGQDEVAYRMLLTMETPRSEFHGNFFVSQMVRRGLPLERILHYCKDLQSRGLNNRALVRCAEVALSNHRTELALPLLREMHQQGMPLRTHYFYPLVLAQGKNEQGVYDVLKSMLELGVDINYDLLAEYVFPAVNTEDTAAVVEKLKGLGLSVSSIVNPLVLYHLQAHKLDKALAVVEQYPVNLVASVLVPSLTACYRETRQAVPAVKLLSSILQGPESTATGTSRTDWAGKFLTECLVEPPADLSNLVPELLANKVHISRSAAETLRTRHGQSLGGSILDMLDQISAEKLDDFSDSRLPSQNDMGIEELEAHLLELQSKGMNTRGALRRLLLLHCRFRHVERALAVAEQLRQDGCTFTGAMHAQLLDLFVSMGDLERARDHLKQVQEVDPSFRLDTHKLLGLAALEASRGHTDEALRLLEKDQGRSNDGDRQTQQPVERALQLLLERCWVSPSATLLAPLVRAHLVKEDVPGALKTFEECARKYRLTPLKGELSRQLINQGRSEELQKVVDISTEVHGEANTLFDLTAYFLECGHMRQAQKSSRLPDCARGISG